MIGVCNAADPSDNEGMFAALASVYKELDRANLTFIYRNSVAVAAPTEFASAGPGDLPAMPAKMPAANLPAASRSTAPAAKTALRRELTSEEAATIAELREKARGAEVICIVRPLANPNAKSEIIVLDKASPAFLDQLGIEQHSQSARRLTSMEVPADSAARGNSRWQSAVSPSSSSSR